MKITIVPYRTEWPDEFQALGKDLRQSLGGQAVRIDHIGSTSVPGLAAKDVIDIQVTVRSLETEIENALIKAGYERLIQINTDHIPPGSPVDPHKKNVIGQWIWAVSNLGWIAFDISIEAYSQAFLFTVYFLLCIWGIISWSRCKPETEKSTP